MSTESISSKITQPYAEAFLELAKKNNAIEPMTQDAQNIIQLISSTKKLEEFFTNPLISIKVKREVVNKIFIDNVSQLTLKFILVLAIRNRIRFLSLIMEKYIELSYRYRAIEVAKVYSATDLSNAQKEALSKKLQEMTSAKHVKLCVEVRSKLIGGFKVQIGSQLLDATIKTQLDQLASSLKSVG